MLDSRMPYLLFFLHPAVQPPWHPFRFQHADSDDLSWWYHMVLGSPHSNWESYISRDVLCGLAYVVQMNELKTLHSLYFYGKDHFPTKLSCQSNHTLFASEWYINVLASARFIPFHPGQSLWKLTLPHMQINIPQGKGTRSWGPLVYNTL